MASIWRENTHRDLSADITTPRYEQFPRANCANCELRETDDRQVNFRAKWRLEYYKLLFII